MQLFATIEIVQTRAEEAALWEMEWGGCHAMENANSYSNANANFVPTLLYANSWAFAIVLAWVQTTINFVFRFFTVFLLF